MSTASPIRIRRPARPYRLIIRKVSRYIAWKPRNGRQETTKETDLEAARAFALRRIATTRPDLAAELGIDITPELRGLRTPAATNQQAA
jgi:hypothetical protein